MIARRKLCAASVSDSRQWGVTDARLPGFSVVALVGSITLFLNGSDRWRVDEKTSN
jgi:hypothetical protein